MTIQDIPTEQLIKDYKELGSTEHQYYSLLKKYFPDSTYESDDVFQIIKTELADRQIDSRNVRNLKVTIPENSITKRLHKKIAECTKLLNEYYGCELTEQAKNELKLLKFILYGDDS